MAKKDKVEEVNPLENKPVKVKKDKMVQCPTCETFLTKQQATKVKKALDLALAQVAGGESVEASSITLPYFKLDVSGLETLYGERSNYYPEGTLEFPWWIVDKWTNGTNLYDRLSVYFDPTSDEDLITDLVAMHAALPAESPRKATFELIVNRIADAWNGVNNPPEEPPGDPLPPPVFP